ncbi:MAG: AgmX/PglI C-terminal domain-containing protein [Bdellovibrionaceae bacterium]|nr:AgmX/PglI C-terminal domain-containing protein [Pseudobdellovibrionaceae bacterium]
METAKKLVLERDNGEVIRTFVLRGNEAHVIQRKDTRRLELVPNLEDLVNKRVKFSELGKIQFTEDFEFDVPGIGRIKSAAVDAKVAVDPEMEEESDRLWWGALFIMALFFFTSMVFMSNLTIQTPEIQEELKQEVVQIIQRLQPKPVQPKMDATVANPDAQVRETAKPVKTGAVKRMGALGVLGSMKNSRQQGGLNLGAAQTTAGPGLGGTEGSGGVQTNIYAKGLVAAPLGAGGNIKGAGGYGTKGKGGGQAGYGTTSLLGATGGTSMALVSEATIDGGLDRDAIAAVINRNLGQVRFCYEQGLQGTPSLAGRVAVDFTIGGNGMVKTASVANTSLGSKIVEDCIVLRLKSWKFPLPQNGVDVKVSYPFVLRRAGQG